MGIKLPSCDIYDITNPLFSKGFRVFTANVKEIKWKKPLILK